MPEDRSSPTPSATRPPYRPEPRRLVGVLAALSLLAAVAPPAAAATVTFTRCYDAAQGWGGFDEPIFGDDGPRIFGEGGVVPQSYPDPGSPASCTDDNVQRLEVGGIVVHSEDLPGSPGHGDQLDIEVTTVDDAVEGSDALVTICSVVPESNGGDDDYCGDDADEVIKQDCGPGLSATIPGGWADLGVIVGNAVHQELDCAGSGVVPSGGTQGSVTVTIS